MADETDLDLQRRALFLPLKTPEALHEWIKAMLGIDLPNVTLYKGPTSDGDSNSNPLELIWDIYNHAVNDEAYDPKFYKILAYASRNGGKTVSSAILEILLLFHGHRDIAHMAAIKAQSLIALKYVKGFLNQPVFSDFITQKTADRIEITKYRHKTQNHYIAPDQWAELGPTEKTAYDEITNFIQLLVATMQSTNGLHCSFVVCDELDVIPNRAAYDELKGVPSETRDGKVAITFLTSTRKFSHGIVQKEIDDSKEKNTGLIIKHWNQIDVANACSPKRHLPMLPKLKIYYETDTFKSISEEAYLNAPPSEQSKYIEGEGFNGCLTQCSLFATCQGKLATEQRDGAAISKSVDSIENDFIGAELDMIKSQFLCLNPSKEGLIYPRIDPKVHLKTAPEMYEMIFRKPAPRHFSKQELVSKLKSEPEIRFFGGMDHGHTDPWAVVIGAKFGHFLFIIEAFQVSNLEIGQKLTVANKTVRHYDATYWPDTNRPDDNKTFALHGYKMRQWSKKGGSIDDGINAVRLKLMPALGQEPEIYFLRDDPGVELLFKHLKQYHWKLDAQQEVVEVPDEENDHLPDAFRYLVMNLFPIKAGERATSQDIIVGSEAVSVKDKEYSEMTPQELQAALYWETMAAKVGVDMGIDSHPRNKKGKRLKFQF